MLLAADLVRGLAVGAIGALAVAGELQLWHLFVLAALFGVGAALFGPAFSAIVPSLVPIGMMFFLGPVYVLLPLVVKQSLGGTASDLGLVFAAGGVGGCSRRTCSQAGRDLHAVSVPSEGGRRRAGRGGRCGRLDVGGLAARDRSRPPKA